MNLQTLIVWSDTFNVFQTSTKCTVILHLLCTMEACHCTYQGSASSPWSTWYYHEILDFNEFWGQKLLVWLVKNKWSVPLKVLLCQLTTKILGSLLQTSIITHSKNHNVEVWNLMTVLCRPWQTCAPLVRYNGMLPIVHERCNIIVHLVLVWNTLKVSNCTIRVWRFIHVCPVCVSCEPSCCKRYSPMELSFCSLLW